MNHTMTVNTFSYGPARERTASDGIRSRINSVYKESVDAQKAMDYIRELEVSINESNSILSSVRELDVIKKSEIDGCIDKLGDIQGVFVDIENRLEHIISNMDVAAENAISAEPCCFEWDPANDIMSDAITASIKRISANASQSLQAQSNLKAENVVLLLEGES